MPNKSSPAQGVIAASVQGVSVYVFYINVATVSTKSATLLAVFLTIFFVHALDDFVPSNIDIAEQTASVAPTHFIIVFVVLCFIIVFPPDSS